MSTEVETAPSEAKVEQKKETKYTTTFLRFEYKGNLKRTLEKFGFKPFVMIERVQYFDGNNYLIWNETVNALRRHNIPVEERTVQEEQLNYECGRSIAEHFEISARVSMNESYLEITSTDKTKRKHKSQRPTAKARWLVLQLPFTRKIQQSLRQRTIGWLTATQRESNRLLPVGSV
jgi:hypothetical protein